MIGDAGPAERKFSLRDRVTLRMEFRVGAKWKMKMCKIQWPQIDLRVF